MGCGIPRAQCLNELRGRDDDVDGDGEICGISRRSGRMGNKMLSVNVLRLKYLVADGRRRPGTFYTVPARRQSSYTAVGVHAKISEKYVLVGRMTCAMSL